MPASSTLLGVLELARQSKFLGPGPLELHVANGQGFVDVLRQSDLPTMEELSIVDLGSGGGVPALVIAESFPAATLKLIERGTNRARFLESALATLGMAGRVEVVTANAEEAAWRSDLGGWADVVTARSFAPPAVTAECACRFLEVDAMLVVSEPPAKPGVASRWSKKSLIPTGLVPTRLVSFEASSFQILTRSGAIAPNLPRRAAVTRRRPLF